MRRHLSQIVWMLLAAMLATPAPLRGAVTQSDGVQWQTDLEAAKTQAKQTGRLVLVHFWTPSCAPCLTLDHTVFNQAGVAAALDQRFVTVKLNANENSATATGFGITRVPTDVILTPDGQVVGKLISPPTPGGYVAEVMQVAASFAATPGQGFAAAAARAPAPSQINAAYANLAVAPNVQPAVTQYANANPAATSATQPQQSPFGPPANLTPAGQPFASPTPPVAAPLGTASGVVGAPPLAAAPAVPATVNNSFAQNSGAPAAIGTTPQPPAPTVNPFVAPVTPVTTETAPPVTPVASSIAPPTPTQGVAGGPTIVTGTSASALSLNLGTAQPAVPPTTVATGGTASTAGAAPTGTGTPDPRQLPPGAAPLGFDGYCPVSMRNNWKWVAGDPRFGVVHRGRTYWFATQSEQQQFWTDPDRYSPALSGMDPVMAIDHQQQVPGKREHSIDYDNIFYMFSSEATLAQFTANPERYAAGVRQAMGIQRGRLVR